MTDDALSLSAVWMSEPPPDDGCVRSAVDAVLKKDRAERERQRWFRAGGLFGLIVLLPALLFCAANGVTPLVRAAYALMAVGVAMLVAAEWIYLDWARQSEPGPADTRSQLQKTVFMLTRQMRLMKTEGMWSSPIFAGVVLLGTWVHEHATFFAALVMWTITAAGWLLAVLHGAMVGARLNARKTALERLLADLPG